MFTSSESARKTHLSPIIVAVNTGELYLSLYFRMKEVISAPISIAEPRKGSIVRMCGGLVVPSGRDCRLAREKAVYHDVTATAAIPTMTDATSGFVEDSKTDATIFTCNESTLVCNVSEKENRKIAGHVHEPMREYWDIQVVDVRTSLCSTNFRTQPGVAHVKRYFQGIFTKFVRCGLLWCLLLASTCNLLYVCHKSHLYTHCTARSARTQP